MMTTKAANYSKPSVCLGCGAPVECALSYTNDADGNAVATGVLLNYETPYSWEQHRCGVAPAARLGNGTNKGCGVVRTRTNAPPGKAVDA